MQPQFKARARFLSNDDFLSAPITLVTRRSEYHKDVCQSFARRTGRPIPSGMDTYLTRQFLHGATLIGMSGLRRQHEYTMHKTDKHKPVGYIFRAWITVKGEKRWAKDYGLKAWRIPLYR